MKKSLNIHHSSRGFTFIEILVVATIIGLLTMIAAVTYQSANKKARDGKRKADLEQIRSALEMSRADSATGVYPGALSTLVPSYIQSLPSPPPNSKLCPGDPLTDYNSGVYTPGAVPIKTYTLCVKLEEGAGTTNYSVTNP